MGDRTDNVAGIEGCGPKTAERILKGCKPDELSLYNRVRQAYKDHYGKRGDELMLLYGRLLKIGGGLWELPDTQEEPEVKDSEVILNDT